MGDTESVHGSATIQQDHVLPVGRRWERHSQRVIRRLFSKITYLLWAGDGRYQVSAWVRNYPTRSRTSCGQAMGETQCVIRQLCSKITYKLWSGDGRYRVSGWFNNYPVRSRTCCGQAMGNTELVDGSAAIQQDHAQTVVGRWEIPSQWVVLRLSNNITYFLWVDNGRD
jgi:hypothetical protein